MTNSTGPPPNFRLLLPDIPNGPALYRSSNPDVVDEQTVARWVDQLGIRTIVDLRNLTELKPYVSDSLSPLASRFPLTSISEVLRPERQPSQRARINVNPTNTTYRINIFRLFPLSAKMTIMYLLAKSLFTGDRSEAEVYGARELFNKSSQAFLYTTFIDFSRQTVAEVFRVLRNESAYGILINCGAGKDRTGVIAAMVMDLLGYDRKKIVEDYHKSEILLAPIQSEIDADFSTRGLDVDRFSRCPKRTMEETLEHIYTIYGGTAEYLKQVGFSDEDLEAIKRNLTRPAVL